MTEKTQKLKPCPLCGCPYITIHKPTYQDLTLFSIACDDCGDGYTVLTPSALPAGLSDIAYMDICLAMVRSAEAIYMLSGWDSSAGAVAEHALASKLALTIIYEDEK